MAYKRFGGEIDNGGSGGRLPAVIGAGLLVFFCFLMLLTGESYFLFLGFSCLILGGVASIFVKKGTSSIVIQTLYLEYLSSAENSFIQRDYVVAIQNYKKAKKHGALPEKHEVMLAESRRLVKKSTFLAILGKR